jgi:hypothetical protein
MFKVYCDCKSNILKVVRKVVKVVDVVFKVEMWSLKDLEALRTSQNL